MKTWVFKYDSIESFTLNLSAYTREQSDSRKKRSYHQFKI